MDWVFQPKFKSEVIPFQDISKMSQKEIMTLPEWVGAQLGKADTRGYLLNPDEWRNVLYDPATPAEAIFRDTKGIERKSK